jgi:hypothetical protein
MKMVKAHSTGTDSGPKVKDLENATVLLHVGKPRKADITYKGRTDRKVIIPCDTWKISFDPPGVNHVGVVRFLQDVLVEKLSEEGIGAWVTTTIIKPNQAYLFESLTDAQQTIAESLIDHIEDGPGPLALGLDDSEPADDDDLEDDEGSGVNPDDEEAF